MSPYPPSDMPGIPSAREAAESRFRRSPYSALRDICCDDRGGVLRLIGRLPTYYLKQLALAEAYDAVGAVPIVVELEVDDPARRSRRGRQHPMPL